MREMLPIIEARRQRYLEHPFIQFLRNPEIAPQLRLSYAQFTCHFVMTFSDINRRFLADDDSADHHQEMVNTHAAEDSRHWSWFLNDLQVLGLDRECRLSDALRFLWSDAGWHVREMGYYAGAVARGANSRERLVLIEAIESMGNVWLESTLIAAREHPLADQLVYFGQHHLDRETGHAIGSARDEVEGIELTAEERARLRPIIDGLFDRMERMNAEILERTLEAAPA